MGSTLTARANALNPLCPTLFGGHTQAPARVGEQRIAFHHLLWGFKADVLIGIAAQVLRSAALSYMAAKQVS